MMDTNQLRYLASQIEESEAAISRLAFCFDTYLEFVEDSREPTKYADGTIAMDASRATEQLKAAINHVLGRASD